jgi:hypothetical protein
LKLKIYTNACGVVLLQNKKYQPMHTTTAIWICLLCIMHPCVGLFWCGWGTHVNGQQYFTIAWSCAPCSAELISTAYQPWNNVFLSQQISHSRLISHKTACRTGPWSRLWLIDCCMWLRVESPSKLRTTAISHCVQPHKAAKTSQLSVHLPLYMQFQI